MAATASRGYFGLSKESVAGTAVAPSKFYPVEEVDFDSPNDMQDIREIRNSRQAFNSFDGAVRSTATLKGAVYAEGALGLLFAGLFGKDTSNLVSPSTTAYKHVFTDNFLPYFTLERSDAPSGGGGVLAERLAGAKVESISIAASYGEKVDLNASFVAMKPRVTTTPVSAGSLSWPTSRALVFKGASTKVGGNPNTDFRSINIEIRNTLNRDEVLNGTNEAIGIDEGQMECTVSGTMRFANLTMLNHFLDGDELALEFSFLSTTAADSGNSLYYGLVIDFPIVRIANYRTQFTAGDSIDAEVDFKIIYDDANKKSVGASLTNKDSTAYI